MDLLFVSLILFADLIEKEVKKNIFRLGDRCNDILFVVI